MLLLFEFLYCLLRIVNEFFIKIYHHYEFNNQFKKIFILYIVMIKLMFNVRIY